MYEYQPVNPLGAFAQSFQMVRGIQDDNARRQQEQMQQQQQMQRQRDLQAAIMNLRTNPSPDAIAEFGLQFPEMKEQMDGYFKTLSEASKQTEINAARDALIAERTGGDIAAVYDQYAQGAENANDQVTAKKFRDAAEFARQNPASAAEVTRIHLSFAAPDQYKLVYASADPTAFQKDFEFIKEKFGVEAATEFAQFGREGAPVSIPLGNGQTYVGPASMAPGASRWQMQGGGQPGATSQSDGEATPEQVSVLRKAAETKAITPEEADVIRKSLGPKGQKAFEGWLAREKVSIARTIGGKTYYQVNGKWYDNPEGR